MFLEIHDGILVFCLYSERYTYTYSLRLRLSLSSDVIISTKTKQANHSGTRFKNERYIITWPPPELGVNVTRRHRFRPNSASPDPPDEFPIIQNRMGYEI